MKKLIALLLVLTMCFGLFAGCGPAKEPVENPTEPSNNEPAPDTNEVTEDKNLEKAVEYLRVYYKDAAEKTPADYKRLAAVRIGTTSYPITWTTDASSDLITIVDNGDGTVTIDINEDNNAKQEADLNYVLTATLTGLDGREATYSWNHILPVGMDYKGIVDAAYELGKGEALEGTFTLVGVIDSINTMYSSDYKNITVTILVEGREDKPIMCYRLKGEGCEKLAVGDTITVTGVLKNYNGTVEFDAGCILEAVVSGGQAPVEAPSDPLEILKAAFALAPGKSLPYEATLTGKVVQVNTPYDSGYGNVSVTISTNGYRLLCYRLKGSGADQINVNDVITVKGQITNYYNVNDGSCTIEFNYPTLVGLTNYAPPTGSTDPTEIINAAYGLAEGASLPYEATLTGVITKIKTPYDSGYGNISVIISVAGNESRPILCYRLKGSGVSGLEVGDTVTVTGYLKNYYGTIEFDAGCRASNIIKAPDPAEEAAKILNALYALQPGESLEGEYSLTGKITEIGSAYSEQYGNITVTIVVEGHEDKPVVAFRMTGEGADTLAIGDTITVTGGLTNYNGTYEFPAGCTFELVSKAEPETPDVPAEPTGTAEVLTELPAAGDLIVIYNSGNAMTATADGNKLAGEAAEIVDGVLELTESIAQLTVSIDENGYYTFTCGDKYLTSGETGNKLFLADEASDYSLWTVEAATENTFYIKNVNAKYVNADGVATYQSMEFYSGFTTYGHKETEIYQMTVLKVVEETTPIADGDQVVIYAPAYNKALSVTKTGFYNVGVDVSVADGVLTGFGETEIFTVIVNEDGTYSFANGEQNIGLADQFSSMDLGAVNADWTLVDLGEGLYLIQNVVRGSYMEWYDSKNNWSTYASESAATDGQFQMAFYVIPAEEEPAIPETLAEQIVEANALANGEYLPYESSITGTITGAVQASSKNEGQFKFTVVDENGNSLLCYYVPVTNGTPVEGDTVTVTGCLTAYNGSAQFDSTASATLAEKEEEPAIPETLAEQIVEANALANGEYLPYESAITGTITGAVQASSKNEGQFKFTVVDENGNSLLCYYVPVTNGTPVEGDTVTVTGCLTAYNGSAQFDSTASATLAEKEEEPAIPETLAEQIVEANALANGEYLPYESAITGTITGAVQASSKNEGQFKFTVVDENGNSLLCYYVPVTNGTPVEGDTVTVTGYLTAYNGSAQFDSTASATLAEKEEEPEVPDEPVQETATITFDDVANRTECTGEKQVWAANGITVTNERGESTAEIKDYSDPVRFYSNTVLTIAYPGMQQITVTCDSAKYADALLNTLADAALSGKATDAVVVITLEAPVDEITMVMNGQVRVDSIEVSTTVSEEIPEEPEEPEVPEEPVIPETLAEQIAEANKLANGAYLTYESTITGVITGAVQASTKNEGQFKFTVVDENGNSLLCYYVPVTNGTPVEGDTITVTGYLTAYNGSAQFDSTASATLAEKVEEPEVPETYMSGPFLMGLYQGNLEKDLFFTGEMDGYYLATTENVEECMPVFLVYTGEQVQIAFYDDAGVLNYVEIQKVGNYVNTVITTTPTMYYTENADYGTLVANVEGTDYYLGTYKTFTTISASKLSYITGEGNFPIQFVETVEYSYPMQLVMEQAKLGKTLYFTGEMAGDYLATSENPADAVDVILVETYTGDAAIGFATADGSAKFVEIYLNDAGKPRVRTTELPESFFTFNEELGIYVTELDGQEYYLGTYGDYTTIGASSTYYITGSNAANVGVSQYLATLQWPAEEEEPSEPEVDPNSPAAILDAAYALAEGESMDHAVELAGKIISVDTEYSEQYGNITVTIAVEGFEDKPVQCFRLKGEGVADLKVGDFILVTGTIMNYNGTVEFDAGCELLSKQVAPETAPETAPEEAPEEAPEVAPEVAPEETPEVAPEETPEAAPEVAPEEVTEEITEEVEVPAEEPVEETVTE